MPSVSEAQARLMRAVAHGWHKPGGGGPSVAVAKDFVAADKAKKMKDGGKVDRSHDIPYLAGISKNGKCLYVDRRVPKTLTVKGKTFDPAKYLRVHESHEHMLMTKHKMPYAAAHRAATEEEKRAVKADGIDWNGYEAEMRGYINETEHEKHPRKPKNLYKGPYQAKAEGGAVESKKENVMYDPTLLRDDQTEADLPQLEPVDKPQREGGLLQTIPRAVELMGTPEGRSKLGSAAAQWWRGDQPGEQPKENRTWGEAVAANPLVKPIMEQVSYPTEVAKHAYETGAMPDREKAAEWGSGTALGLMGTSLPFRAAAPAGEVGVFGGKLKQKSKSDIPYDIPPGEVDSFKQESGPLGSNPGGLYRDPSGQQWYIKNTLSLDHARNERLAAALYEYLGVPTADVHLTTLKGKPAIASPIIKGEVLNSLEHENYGSIRDLQEHLPADAWLANYDSIGLVKDNIIVDEAGKAHRIDLGGSLRYRAQGKPKGDKFGPNVGEVETMRDPMRNPSAAAVFNSPDWLERGRPTAQRIAEMTDQQIKEMVQTYGPYSPQLKAKLVSDLVARRDNIAKIYGVKPEPGVPPNETSRAVAAIKPEPKASPAEDLLGQLAAQDKLNQIFKKHGDYIGGIADEIWQIANKEGPEAADKIVHALPHEALADIGLELDQLALDHGYDPWKGETKEHAFNQEPWQGEPAFEPEQKINPVEEIKKLKDIHEKESGIHGLADKIINGKLKPSELAAIPKDTMAQVEKTIDKMLKLDDSGSKVVDIAADKEKAIHKIARHILKEKYSPEQIIDTLNHLPESMRDQVREGIMANAAGRTVFTEFYKKEILPLGLENRANSTYEQLWSNFQQQIDKWHQHLGEDPAKIWENRIAGGFTTPMVRGSKQYVGHDITHPVRERLAYNDPMEIYGSPVVPGVNSPKEAFDLAHLYALRVDGLTPQSFKPNMFQDGSTIQPMWLNTKDYAKIDAGEWNHDWAQANGAARDEQKKGYKGAIITNVSDPPSGVVGFGNHTTVLVFDKSTMRSSSAMFNPKYWSQARNFASIAGFGVMGALGTMGMLITPNKEQGMASGGTIKKMARGGGMDMENWVMKQASRNLHQEGQIKSGVPGRTDKLPMKVRAGSYVIPADVPAALGQGNSQAGNDILKGMFSMGPMGMAPMKGGNRGFPRPISIQSQRIPRLKTPHPQYAEGGEVEDDGHVPIIAAGHEHVVAPEVVQHLGNGSMKSGHNVLDKFVLKVRKEHINELRKLKPPKT